LTARRHRLTKLVRESIIEDTLCKKIEREIDKGRNSHQIDLELALIVENVLTRQREFR